MSDSDSIATIEVTDTFGGEANYCWVRRHSIVCDGLTHVQVVRRLKKLAGLDGVRAVKQWDSGDQSRYDIVGACICFFITYEW